MRLRRSGGLALALGSAAVGAIAFAACLDDKNPPLQDEAPNRNFFLAGPSSGTLGSGGGPADNCECVAALGEGATGDCGKCFTQILGSQCVTEQATCEADGAGGTSGAGGAAGESCNDVRTCVSNCAGAVACEIACILPPDVDQGHTDYNALLTCACAACGSACRSPGNSCNGGAGGGTTTVFTTTTIP